METSIFEKQARLRSFPPAQLIYIVYRRLVEQGLRPTALWLKDKVFRRARGYSHPATSEVAPRLFVGGQQRPKGLAAMRALGITAVVNMREESDDAARGVALDDYLWLPTTDDAAPALDDLERGSTFIAQHIDAGRGVYIHCGAGVGRAPTMAAAYLVQEGATPEAAWETLQRGRPFIRPTPPQIAAIREFAAQATLESREQAAYERIAGDPGLTGDLTDAEAQPILAWARDEVRRLVQGTVNSDDAEAWARLDPQVRELRQQVRARAKRESSGGRA
ncbi:MAG: dual specificity protein phosphatase family protein [Anaerolineae bacterium]|nr:dual specificity protein phosphatase family protein [Anaerolineae bacterium]